MDELKELNIKPVYGWNDGNGRIYFVYRDTEGKKKIYILDGVKWYFCLPKKELEKEVIKSIIDNAKRTGIVTGLEETNNFYKVFCSGDKKNYLVKEFISRLKNVNADIREADLTLVKRYIVDNLVEIEENQSFVIFDIETDDTNRGIVIGRDQIISWAACDNTGKTFYKQVARLGDVKEETDLIRELVKLFMQYDIIVGWNSKQFDLPYIIERITKLDIKTKNGELLYYSTLWKTFVHVDLMQRLIKLFGPMMTTVGLTGFSLNEVSKVFIGEQKVERPEKINELFTNNPEKLKEYNIKDVKLVYTLNEKLRILPLMIKECVWTGTFMDRFYIGELLDNYILREANKQDFHLKTRPEYDEAQELEVMHIRGGYVMEPITGLFDNIRTLDFKSMYPSIIVSWNIGQESLVEGRISETAFEDFERWIAKRKIEVVPFLEWYNFLRKENKKLNPDDKYLQTANNQYFKRDKPSIIASLVKRLLAERKAYKKQQLDSEYNTIEYKNAQASQEAVKEMSNSMYGITADKQSRFFDPRVAEAITMTGQFLNRITKAIIEKIGYKAIYGDTDSIFIDVDDDDEITRVIEETNIKLTEHLIKTYKFTESIIYIEYEKKFRKFIMLDKKRYSGHLVEIDGKKVNSILSKGTENVRKSTIEFTRKKVEECLELIVRQDKGEKFMKKWMMDLKEYVMTVDIPGEELAVTMKLSKPISSYKSKPPHVRLAEKMIVDKEILETHEGKHVWGQKIEYIIVDSKKKNESILLRDFKGEWDRRYYWDVQVYAPLMRILKTVWPKTNWEEHNILLFEKAQKKKGQEEKKKEKEALKIEKEKNKKSRKKKELVLEKTS